MRLSRYLNRKRCLWLFLALTGVAVTNMFTIRLCSKNREYTYKCTVKTIKCDTYEPLHHEKDGNISTKIVPKKFYMCPYWNGGLGNQMFHYASLYGISSQKGLTLVLQNDDLLAQLFPNIRRNNAVKNITILCDDAVVVAEKQACAFGLQSYSFNDNQTVFHRSYLQSWKYFQFVENNIREQFVFDDSVRDKAIANIEQHIKRFLHQNMSTAELQVIGVHIRRGDYLSNQSIEYGYNVATKEYIDKAMDYFRLKYNQTLFLVFTNPDESSLQWRNDNINGSDVINMIPGSPEIDMCSMSLCNHTIMTVGTFGWWAAWLANGTTIYFKDIARQHSSLRSDFSADMADFFPPSWIGM